MYFNINFKLLDNRFCFTSQDAEYFKRTNVEKYIKLKNKIIVRHFETNRKPWLTNMFRKDIPLDNFNDFWFFAGLTPFYNQLLIQYIGNIQKDIPPEIIKNINKPTQEILYKLRTKILHS